MLEKKGNSTWVNLDDLRSLFSEEEIEARKREIIEQMELKRKQDFEAKELIKQERKEKQDKGWTSSIIRPGRTPEVIEEEPSLENQIEVIKEVKEIVNSKLEELLEEQIEEPFLIEEEEEPVIIEEKEIIEEIIPPGLVKCPECEGLFAKGGAFANHYKSHFNGE